MQTIKKIFYGFLVFVIILVTAIVFAANSSWVIKKAADKFAPDYKISYDDITGNVFTGVKIAGLKFDGDLITENIKFSWNPSKILYKRVAINELSVEGLDVDVVKALIASFPSSEEDNSSSKSAPLPVVILEDKVHVDINPFEEQGVLISKTELDIEDVVYSSDGLDIENLALQIDTNIAKILLESSLENGKLEIEKLLIEDIDTIALEKKFLVKDENSSEIDKTETEVTANNEEPEPLNPLVPKEVVLKYFSTTILPRLYKSANIEQVKVEVKELNVNVEKVISNKVNSIGISSFSLLFDSNVSNLNLLGNLNKETITIEDINLKDINTLALQALFVPDTNTSKVENEDTNNSNENEKEKV